jgi:hypothetical protein
MGVVFIRDYQKLFSVFGHFHRIGITSQPIERIQSEGELFLSHVFA